MPSPADGELVLPPVAISLLASRIARFGRLAFFLPPRQPVREAVVVPSRASSASYFLFTDLLLEDGAVTGATAPIIAKSRTGAGVWSPRIILTGRSDSSKSIGASRFMVAKREGMVTCSAEGNVSDGEHRGISLGD
jgi:hypothetical protein